MMQQGRSRAAVAVALMMYCYLRPGEMALLQAWQLIPPANTSGLRHWPVALHPGELGRASETGAFDDNIPLDLPHMAWLGDVMTRLKKQLAPNERVLDMTQSCFSSAFRQAVEMVGAEPS